jgi:hypothetical protein
MEIYFASNYDALTKIPEETLSNTTFICFDWKTLTRIREHGLSAEPIDRFITNEEGKSLDAFLMDLKTSWYAPDGRDITHFRGISLGKIYEWVLWWDILIPYYKFLLSAVSILEAVKPSRIMTDSGVPSDYIAILKTVAERNGNLKVYVHNGEQKRGDKTSAELSSLKVWSLPKVGFKKKAAGAIMDLIFRIRKKRKSKMILLEYYFSLKNLLLQWPDLNKNYDFCLTLLSAPLSLVKEKNALIGKIGIFNAGTNAYLNDADIETLSEIRKKWKRSYETKESRLGFLWKGYDISHVIKPHLDEFFDTTIDTIAKEVGKYDLAFLASPPSCIVLPFDTPPAERIIVEIGKKYHVPSVTILHGLPFSYNLYDNSHTDFLIVPGLGIKTEYEKIGGNIARIKALGNPKFDEYAKMKAVASTVKQGSSSRPKILVLTYPKVISSVLGEETLPEEFIVNAIGILKDLDIGITVKLHPAESLEYYQSILPEKDNISVVRNEPIEKLIGESDLIVSTFSTVLLEALVTGKKVVCFNPSARLPYPEPCGSYLEVVTDYQKLKIKVLESLQSNKTPDYSGVVADFAGEIDGRSSKRILDFIAELVGNKQ